MMSIEQLVEVHDWMMRNNHYSKADRQKMSGVEWYSNTAKELYTIVRLLMKYPQLVRVKGELKDTADYYKPAKLKIHSKTEHTLKIVWNISKHISNQLRGKLDKSQYNWTRIGNRWILILKWDYVPQFVKIMESLGVDCRAIQPTLF